MRPRPRWLLSLLVVLLPLQAAAQAGAIRGVVSSGSRPIPRAQVEVISGARLLNRVFANDSGAFVIQLDPGTYTVVARALGFARVVLDSVRVVAAAEQRVDVTLEAEALRLDAIVVTPNTRAMRALDVPVSIGIVDEQQVIERTVSTPLEYVTGLAGVDIAHQGVEDRQVVARGFNQTFGTSLLMMADYRGASIPSLRGNLAQYLTPVAEDIDRVEVLRGPASALYGPNAADGVVHFISRSPFDSPGLSISLTGGGRDLFQGSVRQATVHGTRLASKVSLNYFRAREWPAPPDTFEVTPRDPIAERWNGEARLDYRLAPDRTATFTVGSSLARRHVEYLSIGASQIQDWRYDFMQARYSAGRFFANAYLNRSNAGQTYGLRTLSQPVDRSTVLVGQVRHTVDVGDRTTLTWGADVHRTNPVTDTTINGRYEDDDRTLETGAFAEAEVRLAPRWQLFAAARLDRHDRMPDAVFSPRLALQFAPAEGQRLRVRYDRAFSTPTPTDLFVDVHAASLAPLPYNLRAVGVPKDGLRFERECGGLCLRSPFAAGTLPLDVTPTWPALVQVLQGFGIDLSQLPAPTAQQVGTVLRLLNAATGTFEPVTGDLVDIAALRPTITNAVEVGWKGALGQSVVFDLSWYRTRREDFRGPLAIATPNAFLDTDDLTAYLAQFMSAEEAAGLGTLIGGIPGNAAATGIPLATASPSGLLQGSDILLTYRSFGRVTYWGSDVSLEVLATPLVTLMGTWSYVSRNFFAASAPGNPDLSMNAPKVKATAGARYRDPYRNLSAEVRARHAGGFRMLDGVWDGRVEGFTTIDTEVGFALPGRARSRLTITVQNLFNDQHPEFFAAPVIGRLVLTRLSHTF